MNIDYSDLTMKVPKQSNKYLTSNAKRKNKRDMPPPPRHHLNICEKKHLDIHREFAVTIRGSV